MDRRESWRYRDRVTTLIDYLEREDILADPMWRAGLQEVPRHLFVPDRAYASAMFPRGSSRAIDRQADPTDWWNAIYTNCSVITQRDEGRAAVTDTTASSTCALSCPHISMTYLRLLDVADHHRILEVGTGTGWTAGMLAWRLSGGQVTTVEVDEGLSKTAADHLAAAGLSPVLVVGDGAAGWAEGGPYDRVHVTCGVRDVPYAWVEQTRPGGLIVLPWMPRPGGSGLQLVLAAAGDEAVGRFTGGGGFMMLRAQQDGLPPVGDGPVVRSQTRMDPRLVAGADGGALIALAARMPGVHASAEWDKDSGGWAYVVRLADPVTGSWALARARKGAVDYEVLQSGGRALWDEAAAGYLWWVRCGMPGAERFGMTVGPGGQEVWLDSPDRLVGLLPVA